MRKYENGRIFYGENGVIGLHADADEGREEGGGG